MIQTEKHLSYILKADLHIINEIIKNIDNFYISWKKKKINKDTGKVVVTSDGTPKYRQLNSTKQPLKVFQQRIYRYLLNNIMLPDYCYGGVPKKDNVRNARFHQGNKYVFTTDIKAFFPSISHKQVFELYRRLNFSPSVSRILTQLTTYKGELPQGVPTSTLLANLVFATVGDKINTLAKQNNMKFSIFVDDVTISSKSDFKEISLDIIKMIQDGGFKISHTKTNYKTKNPIITGIKCQNNRLKLQQKTYKRLNRLAVSPSMSEYQGLYQYRKRIDSI